MANKISIETAIERINNKCKEKNLEFRGFVDEFKNKDSKIILYCPKHNYEWASTSYNCFINFNHGCSKCSGVYKPTEEEVIEEVTKICNEYNYDFIGFVGGSYVNAKTKLILHCRKHNYTWDRLTFDNFRRGRRCPLCKNEKLKNERKKTTDEFIEMALKIHGNKYDYSKVEYANNATKVCIICPIHGEFYQQPIKHTIRKHGCPKCSGKNKTNDEWIKEAISVHGNKYDYSKSVYSSTYKKVCIKCPTHGEFYQLPQNHIIGNGCPKCNNSSMEITISKFLKEKYDSIFIEQKKFDWLSSQSLDFFIPSKNVAIECQGIQHFKPIKHFGGEEEFKKRVELDKKKKQLCEEHGIKLLYFSNLHIDYPYKVYEDTEELLKEIQNE